MQTWDFPGSPVIKTSPSNAGGVGSIPGGGGKIPCASWPKNPKYFITKNKQKTQDKDFKNGSHKKEKILNKNMCKTHSLKSTKHF